MMMGMGYLVIMHVKTILEAKILISAVPNVGDPVPSARAVGVYRMPDRDEPVCTGLSGGCKVVGWRRHVRGHMVHLCGLRNQSYREQLAVAIMDWFGINLMPRERTPKVFRNPPGWDRPTKKRP